VSDLHNEQFGDGQQGLISKIEAIGPDMIAVTGDLIDARHTNTAVAMEFIEAAVKIAPVYFVTGNHEAWSGEYEALKQQLIQAGVNVLDGKVEEVAYKGEQITLLGIEDPSFSERSAYVGDQETVDESIKELVYDKAGYSILLSHRPEVFSIYAANEVNLVLTGHAHGGQFRIPFVGGVVAPDQGLFPQYTSGVFIENDTQMVVSRGLGNSIIPFRINNRPELVVVKLYPTQ
jgi:predicted MPP superfamily phosphohydrolase